jgi:hypothetical protein
MVAVVDGDREHHRRIDHGAEKAHSPMSAGGPRDWIAAQRSAAQAREDVGAHEGVLISV